MEVVVITIEDNVINNLEEAAEWLREAWAFEPYNIHYINVRDIEYIDIEPTKDRDDLSGWVIESLEEFENFVTTH